MKAWQLAVYIMNAAEWAVDETVNCFSLKEKGGEEHCKDEIESHNECLRKNGLSVIATSPV